MNVIYKETSVATSDGANLFTYHWEPPSMSLGRVLILHGYAEHGERYRDFAHHLCSLGLSCVAYDMRGHGRSPGLRGHIDFFDQYLDDLDRVIATVDKPFFILGHSHGALIALDHVSRKSPKIEGLVVTNPFLALSMKVPLWKTKLAYLAARFMPRLSLPSGIEPAGVSHDMTIVERYRHDRRIFKTATAGWFVEVQSAQQRVREISAIDVPLLYLYSDSDPIASPSANQALAAQIQAADKEVVVREGELHEILNETRRHEVYSKISTWFLKRLSERQEKTA